MLKNSLLSLLMLLCILPAGATTISEDNRVVLAMPGHFNKIVANGNLTVEVIFHKQHKGYVVYNAADTLAPKIHCTVDGENTLYLSGSTEVNSVKSRVLVLACDSLTSVINNESGTVLIKEIPRVSDFCAISNGSGSVKCQRIRADHLMLSDNGTASLAVDEAKARFIDIYGNSLGYLSVGKMLCHGTRILNNANGEISVSELKTRRGEIINNADGSVTVAGKAHAFAVVNYSTGKINISAFTCRRLNNANYGKGAILLK